MDGGASGWPHIEHVFGVVGDKPAVCKALKRSRLGGYVEETYNTNSLSAYIRELDREDKPLSDALAKVLEISEVFKLRTRKS